MYVCVIKIYTTNCRMRSSEIHYPQSGIQILYRQTPTYEHNLFFEKYPVVRPSWALKPGLTDRLVVSCKVTLTTASPCA
jgi:hypothetical protein